MTIELSSRLGSHNSIQCHRVFTAKRPVLDSQQGAYVSTFHWDRLRICRHNCLYSYLRRPQLLAYFDRSAVRCLLVRSHGDFICHREKHWQCHLSRKGQNKLSLGVRCCAALTVGLWYERVQDEGGSPKDHSAYAARVFSLMLTAAFCGVYVRGKEKEDAR